MSVALLFSLAVTADATAAEAWQVDTGEQVVVIDGTSLQAAAAITELWCAPPLGVTFETGDMEALLIAAFGRAPAAEECAVSQSLMDRPPEAPIALEFGGQELGDAFIEGDPRDPIVLGFGGQELGDALWPPYGGYVGAWLQALAGPTWSTGEVLESAWGDALRLSVWIDIDRIGGSFPDDENRVVAELAGDPESVAARRELAAAVAWCSGFDDLSSAIVPISTDNKVQAAREAARLYSSTCAQLP